MDDFADALDFDWPSQLSQRSRASVTSSRINASPLPQSIAPSPIPNETPGASSSQFHPFGTELTFMEEENWDPDKTYDENPPFCIRYLFQWKVMKNGTAFVKDKATDVVVSPECYRRRVLQAEREQALRKRFPRNRSVCPDEVSVTGRSQRPFTKIFKESEIDWAIVEKHLLARVHYLEKGKELQVVVSYNYETAPQPIGRSARGGGKRGRTLATTRIVAEMDQLLEDEQ